MFDLCLELLYASVLYKRMQIVALLPALNRVRHVMEIIWGTCCFELPCVVEAVRVSPHTGPPPVLRTHSLLLHHPQHLCHSTSPQRLYHSTRTSF